MEKQRKNLSHFTNLISNINNSDIILLPEMFNTAFCPSSIDLSEAMSGKTITWMKQIALEKNSAIAGSLMVNEKNKVYNRMIWVSKKEKFLNMIKDICFL